MNYILSTLSQILLTLILAYRYFFVYSLSLIVYSSYAQQYNTCKKALKVNSSNDVIVNCKGAPDQHCAQYIGMEHNTAWLTFVVPKDTILTFNIIPSNSRHDMNFLLFKSQTKNFCRGLGTACPTPIRLNIANLNHSKGSRTGLSATDVNNSAYSKSLKVYKGERFYLLVDDVTSSGSFNFYLHLPFHSRTDKSTKQNNSFIDARPMKVPPIQKPSISKLQKRDDTLSKPSK